MGIRGMAPEGGGVHPGGERKRDRDRLEVGGKDGT